MDEKPSSSVSQLSVYELRSPSSGCIQQSTCLRRHVFKAERKPRPPNIQPTNIDSADQLFNSGNGATPLVTEAH